MTMSAGFFILSLAFATIIGGTIAVYEDCDAPPPVAHSIIELQETEEVSEAIYNCIEGYELRGSGLLTCDFETNEWDKDPPICVQVSSEVEPVAVISERKRKLLAIPEELSVSDSMAAFFDLSCIQAKVIAPEINHGKVEKYERRRKGEKLFLVAYYVCNENFEFETTEVNVLYCSAKQWIGEIPTCLPTNEFEEDDEYDEYESVHDDEDDDEEGVDSKLESPATEPLPPPPQATATADVANEVELIEPQPVEIQPIETEQAAEIPDEPAVVQTNESLQPNVTVEPVTDINIVVEPTQDPYTPRVLDNNCGIDNGGCAHACERLLFPDENEPRLKCSCFSGFTLSPADYTNCLDIDECQENNGGCEQVCNNLPGSFECACESGYQIDASSGNTCIDINECTQPDIAAQCPAGCENTPGSFSCVVSLNDKDEAVHEVEEEKEQEVETQDNWTPEPEIAHTPEQLECEAGFRASSEGLCEDVDECAEGSSGCENCLNTLGGYECTCPPGYGLAGDHKACVDINECEIVVDFTDTEDHAVPHKVCSQNCQNTPGSYVCDCRPNYHLLADQRTCAPDSCQDLDNPQLNKQRCAHQCVDREDGRYECVCPIGYKLDADLRSCMVLKSICTLEDGYERCRPGTCESSANNTSFSCLCPPGYANEMLSCQDIDECAAGTHACSHECYNTEGGYGCLCPGHMLLSDDEHTCIATDVCAANNNGCEHICRSKEGGACVCQHGYSLGADGKSCHDIDECQLGNGGCQQLCRNLPGDYECACQRGFEFLDGALSFYCFDIDECALGTHSCEPGLVCENLNGSFTCLCPTGFALSINDISPIMTESPNNQLMPHHACLDIDECSIRNGNCSHFCLNFPGGFYCACPPGYELSPRDNRSCLLANACLFDNGGCSHDCRNVDGISYCVCPPGLKLDAASLSCLDIDECALDFGNCSGICINLLGSFACACDAGYQLAADAHSCIDVDECAEGQHRCTHECVNKAGGFECACRAGYELDVDTYTCLDLNACTVDHGCSDSCTKIRGFDVCQCPRDFLLSTDGKTCLPISVGCPPGSKQSDDGSSCLELVCEHDNGGCSHICLEQTGCSCPLGLILGADGKTCEDVDECLFNNAGCAYNCENHYGSFECTCPAGQKLIDGKKCQAECGAGYRRSILDATSCVDIDECARPGICQYQCVNRPGTYECTCPTGYQLSNGRECVDVDECAVNNGGCKGGSCVNQNGSFQCKCGADQRLAVDRRTCENRAEARDQCPEFKAPKNGEVRCSKYRHKKKRFYNTKCSVRCNAGYQLQGPPLRICDASGRWDNFENTCLQNHQFHQTSIFGDTTLGVPNIGIRPAFDANQNVVCPTLKQPQNGIIFPTTCTKRPSNVGVSCHLQCQNGFVPTNALLTTCMPLLGWSFNGNLDCRPFGVSLFNPHLNTLPQISLQPTLFRPVSGTQKTIQKNRATTRVHTREPYIRCPQNALIVLNQGQTRARVILQKPVSNVDFRFIEASPSWAKDLQAHLEAGTYELKYHVGDPNTGKSAGCQTTIKIERSAPAAAPAPARMSTLESLSQLATTQRPTLGGSAGNGANFCTPSFEVKLRANQNLRSVIWEEPRFEGELLKLYKSHFPGALFGVGVHPVQYEATNKDGLTMRCSFKIHVKAGTDTNAATLAPLRLNYHKPKFLTHQSLAAAAPARLTQSHVALEHDSYVICPNQEPIKVTVEQSVNLPVGCTLRNVRPSPQSRQYLKRGLLTAHRNPFSN